MREATDASEQKAIDDVTRHGWHVIQVLEDEIGPGFAYTVGLQYSFHHPELIVVGVPLDTAHQLLNLAAEAIRRGARYDSGAQSQEFLAGKPCRFLELPETEFQNYVGWNLWFYDGSNFRVLQLIWPDQSGPKITIECEEPGASPCACCGGEATRLTRFVYRNGDAYAVYYALFSHNHQERHVSLIVSIGEWADNASPSLRVAFPMRLWAAEDDLIVTVTDASESPWRDAEILGRVLDREEALAHPRVKEVFLITDHIFAEDTPIREYFHAAG